MGEWGICFRAALSDFVDGGADGRRIIGHFDDNAASERRVALNRLVLRTSDSPI